MVWLLIISLVLLVVSSFGLWLSHKSSTALTEEDCKFYLKKSSDVIKIVAVLFALLVLDLLYLILGGK